MSRLLYPALLGLSLLSLSACKAKKQEMPRPAAVPSPPLPVVAIDDVPAPAPSSVTLAAGSNLGAVAAKAYGHERFAGFVATVNGITDPARVKAGAILQTPSLAMAFRDAGLDPAFQPALNVLAKACSDTFATLPVYLEARRTSGNTHPGAFPIPPEIQARLRVSANAIDAALAVLSTAAPPHTVPTKAIGQFQKVAALLRTLATGQVDGYGYDTDEIGQRFGLGFTNALIWVREEKR